MTIFERLNFKAIGIGILADIGVSLVAGIIMQFLLSAMGYEVSNLEKQHSNVSYMAMLLIIGLLITSFGGYVAARIAKVNEKINASAVGVFGFLFGLLFINVYPIWFTVLSVLLVIPFAYIGGLVAVSRKQE